MSSADRYTLETPENIEVDFELAGLGSRFCAMLIDTLLNVLVILAIIVLGILFDVAAWPVSGRAGVDWMMAALVAIVTVLIFGGYFIFFELLMRGQTPGKRSMKIRVIREDGTPVTANEVLVRNILRLVDFLPACYGLGAVVMFCSPLCKRLGDVAAGTIVVKEGQLDYRANADKKYAVSAAPMDAVNSELTSDERRLLTGFLQRRGELLPEARNQLASRLAEPLHEKYGGLCGDPESYLVRLVEGRTHES